MGAAATAPKMKLVVSIFVSIAFLPCTLGASQGLRCCDNLTIHRARSATRFRFIPRQHKKRQA